MGVEVKTCFSDSLASQEAPDLHAECWGSSFLLLRRHLFTSSSTSFNLPLVAVSTQLNDHIPVQLWLHPYHHVVKGSPPMELCLCTN